MKLWRILSVCALLVLASPVFAATVQKSSGLSLARSGGNTARGTVNQVGGDFGALLQKPANLSGGSSDFSRLLDMPFKLSDLPADKATVKGVLTPKNIAKALRGGVGGYLAGEAFKRLAEEACVRLVGGSMQLTESGAWEECVPGNGGSTPSTGYAIGRRSAPDLTFYTPQAACQSYLEGLQASQPSSRFRLESCTGPSGSVDGQAKVARLKADGSVFDYFTDAQFRKPSGCAVGKHVWSDGSCHDEPQTSDVTWRPVTTDQVQQKIEDVVKVPGNASKVWDAMRDYADKGGQFDMDSPLSVVGPAQSPASVSTTQSTQPNPTGTGSQTLTTTNTTVNNYTYAGDTITINQITTSVTRNEAGQVVSSTTTTKNPDPVDEAPADTPLPAVPDLYVRKYPNGMEGIYNEYKDRLKGTPVAQLAKQLMPNIGDGGTCPSWPFNLNLEVWALYGVHDVAPPCWIWAVGKAILILSALLLARALIFGG